MKRSIKRQGWSSGVRAAHLRPARHEPRLISFAVCAVFVTALVGGSAGHASACRGLAHHLLPWSYEGGLAVTSGFTYEQLAFDRSGVRGSYASFQPRINIAWGRWSGGLTLPIYAPSLQDAADPAAGFGNPRARIEAGLIRSLDISGGVEIEAPLGASARGLASDHWEALPFVSVQPRVGPWIPMASIGVRFAEAHTHGASAHATELHASASRASGHGTASSASEWYGPATRTSERYGPSTSATERYGPSSSASEWNAIAPEPGSVSRAHPEHPEDPVPAPDPLEDAREHDEDVLLVNPHADRELLYHVGLATEWAGRTPAVFYDGQYVLRDIEGPRHFGTVGFEMGFALLEKYWITPGIEIPVGSDRRLDWAFKVSFDPMP